MFEITNLAQFFILAIFFFLFVREFSKIYTLRNDLNMHKSINQANIEALEHRITKLENSIARLQQEKADKKHIEKLKYYMPRVNL